MRKILRKIIVSLVKLLVFLVVLEQLVLNYVVDPQIFGRTDEFKEFIEKNRDEDGLINHINWWVCEEKSLYFGYRYNICIFQRGENNFTLKVEPTAGYFSLIPWDYSDRIIIFRTIIYLLDDHGKIKKSY